MFATMTTYSKLMAANSDTKEPLGETGPSWQKSVASLGPIWNMGEA